jgi:hypothetical protein
MNFLNLSNYGETTTDDYWSKKRSAEAEKEIVVLSNKATRLLIQGFFIYGAVGVPGIINGNLIG